MHLLPEVGDPGSIAGSTICAWHGIPKGAKVGIALGDFQCSVYSCLTERTDAGMIILVGYLVFSLSSFRAA